MVEHTAHNGNVAGSSPAKPKFIVNLQKSGYDGIGRHARFRF